MVTKQKLQLWVRPLFGANYQVVSVSLQSDWWTNFFPPKGVLDSDLYSFPHLIGSVDVTQSKTFKTHIGQNERKGARANYSHGPYIKSQDNRSKI